MERSNELLKSNSAGPGTAQLFTPPALLMSICGVIRAGAIVPNLLSCNDLGRRGRGRGGKVRMASAKVG